MNPVSRKKQRALRRDMLLRLTMRVLGFVLTIWAAFLLTRDFVLGGDAALWFVAVTGVLGVFAFISSWWQPRPQRQHAAASKARWSNAAR